MRNRIEINMRVRKRLRGGALGWCMDEKYRNDEHSVGTEARRYAVWANISYNLQNTHLAEMREIFLIENL